MKNLLTVEQSATPRAKGVSADKASEKKPEYTDLGTFIGNDPIFTLADLLSLLPKSIEHGGYAEAKLNIYTRPHRRECWVAKYIVSAKTIPYEGAGEELIDALYEVLCKLLDNHVKLD